MTDTIRIGSRGSQLALWQANHVASALRERGCDVAVEIIRTTGDRMAQQRDAAGLASDSGNLPSLAPLAGDKGIFIKEIEEALASGHIDLAVHSLKDLPTQLDPRFLLAAVPERADARDAFVCQNRDALDDLPRGGRIGTTSPRRRAQLLALRPDLRFVDLRGNIDTRLRKLADGACDALVLAAAGLDRLNRTEWVRQRFSFDQICPAPGQGALALETRAVGFAASADPARDDHIRQAVASLDHPAARFSVEAERAVLGALGGGCQLAVGVHCAAIRNADAISIGEAVTAAGWHIQAQVLAPDGTRTIRVASDAATGAGAGALGIGVAEELISRGALDLLGNPD